MEADKHAKPERLLFPAAAGVQIWLEEDQAVFQVMCDIPFLFDVWSQFILQVYFWNICY